MHLGLAALNSFYQQHKLKEVLVLATVIGTQGSTYRKPGAMMLISAGGEYAGMISGGCLEADLLEHAATVFRTGEPKHVTYDMYADEQLVWSLGLGCDGVIHLLLQRLERQRGFAFLPLLFDSQQRRVPAVMALVTRSQSDSLPAGCYALVNNAGESCGSEALLRCIDDHEFQPSSRHADTSLVLPDGTADVLMVDIQPVPGILICGAGPDAVPVVKLITGLGWQCIVADHRSHYARAGRFPGAARVIHSRPGDLAMSVTLADIDAAVIMSHNLEHDFSYLEMCLSTADLSYIGILGPAARRKKLLERVDKKTAVVFGPVGLDIGAELPESIALSVVAEIHAVLNQRSGGSLTNC